MTETLTPKKVLNSESVSSMKKGSAFQIIGQLIIIYSFHCLISLAFSHLHLKNYCWSDPSRGSGASFLFRLVLAYVFGFIFFGYCRLLWPTEVHHLRIMSFTCLCVWTSAFCTWHADSTSDEWFKYVYYPYTNSSLPLKICNSRLSHHVLFTLAIFVWKERF